MYFKTDFYHHPFRFWISEAFSFEDTVENAHSNNEKWNSKLAWEICQRAWISICLPFIQLIEQKDQLLLSQPNEPIYPQKLLHYVTFVKNHIEANKHIE